MFRTNIFLCLSAFSLPICAEQVRVSCTPGNLHSLVGDKSQEVTELIVTGEIDARDFESLRSVFPLLESADLSAASVVSYTANRPDWLDRSVFPGNHIPSYAFHNSGIKFVSLPSSVISIGEGAFAGSALETVEIPVSVRSVGDWAFHSSALTAVSLPAVSELGKGVFQNCRSLQRADLSEVRVSRLPEFTFESDVALTLVSLPDMMTAVGVEAFSGSGLRDIDISGIADVEEFAYANMPYITSAVVGENVSEGEFFNSPRFSSVSGSPRHIGDSAFAGCHDIFKLALTVNAETIGASALAGLNTEFIFLGADLRSVGRDVFHSMSLLRHIDVSPLGGNIPDTDTGAFDGLDQDAVTLHVAASALEAWKSHPQWGKFNVTAEAVGIDTPVFASGIYFRFDGPRLILHTPEEMSSVSVYDSEGLLVASLSPGSTEVSVDTSSSSSRIFVINVSHSGSEDVIKAFRP